MNFSISISGYVDTADEDAAVAFEQKIEDAAKQFAATLDGVQAASVSTDRVRVVDAKEKP